MNTGASASPAMPPVANPWRRLMGIVYETIILFGVVWFADYTFSALTQFRGAPGPLRTAFQLFTLAVLAAYFTGFWSRGRRSLPMKTMSLQIVDRNGQALSSARALARFSAAAAMLIAALAAGRYLSGWFYPGLLLPFAWTLVDRDRRALYDLAAGTWLVELASDKALRSVDV